MKKIVLTEASNLTALEKMELFNAGRRNENLKACKIDKVLDYYKICLDNNLHMARAAIEGELTRRDLTEHIVPLQYLQHPNVGMFTSGLASIVADAHGDERPILDYAYKSFSHGGVVIAAYVLALAIDDHSLEQGLRFFIKTIGTYSKYMQDYLYKCSTNTKILDRINELLEEMEE